MLPRQSAKSTAIHVLTVPLTQGDVGLQLLEGIVQSGTTPLLCEGTYCNAARS